MGRRKIQVKFKGSMLYAFILMIINLALITLSDFIAYKGLIFLGNVIAIGFIFPLVTLYVDHKERFMWKKYLYFSILTCLALFTVCELFVYRFIEF